MSASKELETILREDWADISELEGVRVIATERELDDIQVPTAVIRVNRIGRHPNLPLSHRNVGMTLTLISPHLDLDRAGEQLEALVAAALDYLDTRFSFDDATSVSYLGRAAFDIPLTLIAQKD